jgi:hypothetical protein
VTVPNDEILKDERLLEWRLKRFAELGFSAAESSELAESDVDHHLAGALASAGCPLELCARSSSRRVWRFDWRNVSFAFAAAQANDELLPSS